MKHQIRLKKRTYLQHLKSSICAWSWTGFIKNERQKMIKRNSYWFAFFHVIRDVIRDKDKVFKVKISLQKACFFDYVYREHACKRTNYQWEKTPTISSSKNIRTPKKHYLLKCLTSAQIKQLTFDWSHLIQFKQLF